MKNTQGSANLLASYARGPRIWDAASLLPQVAELAAAGLIEPVPDSTAYRLTAAGQAELNRLQNARILEFFEGTEAGRELAARIQTAGINAAPGLAGSVVLYASDIEAAHILRFLQTRRPDMTAAPGQEATLTVTIPLTAAMRTPDDLGLALRQVAAKIQGGTGSGKIRDKNGNFAGEFDITPGTTSGLESGTQ